MDELRVPLTVFRPEVFYRWLFRQWHEADGLSQASRDALGEIHPFFARDKLPSASANSLQPLLTFVDCAKMLPALSDEDFDLFIDWALQQPWPEGVAQLEAPIDHTALDVSSASLRQQLVRYYDPERIWPRHGLRPLLDKAQDVACQAEKAVPLAHNAITLPQKERAVQQIHDGIDRCLLYVEHFLELLVEFLAVVAGYAGLADDQEQQKWLKRAGIGLTPEDKNIAWDTKQQELQKIRKKFEDLAQVPVGWEHLWSDLLRLISHFRDGNPKQPGLQHLTTLRDYRNSLRHAGHTLDDLKSIPTAYQKAIPGIRAAVAGLRENSQDLLPGRARILEYRRDYTGGVELLLTLEDRRLVVLRYDHEQDASLVSGIRLWDLPNRLVYAVGEQEYFLYPMPREDESLIVNALLLPSPRPGERTAEINVKREALIIVAPTEFIQVPVVEA